ncbi:hypothetical protein SAMN06295912_11051 [Sphingomonas laterariae]|uniref:Uncharacterized protein n=1 Tax=Edaphosphingomonas laterariae TaxID=861865 RepID=A0A239FUV3_9SPHN|nr:hypothetical protein [Sphingomonas laterariae]SNS60661.1 hypothetical protein SAMN06295912_11051 [Sphingomonas laterariae]
MSIAFLMAMAAASAPLSHTVSIDHGGSPLAVTYTAEVKTRMHTVSMVPPTRIGPERCRWTAVVTVERDVQAGGKSGLNRALPGEKEIRGDRAGNCHAGRKAIGREIEAKTASIQSYLRQVAAEDRPALLADIDTARALALN